MVPASSLLEPLLFDLCGTETAIDGPGPSSEYTGWQNIVDDLGLMNLSTISPLAFPRSLIHCDGQQCFQVIHDQRIWGGGSFPIFSLMCPGRTNYGAGFIPA